MSETRQDRSTPLQQVEQQPRPERIRGQERFRRSARLRSSLDFQRVRRRGRSLGGALLALGYARQDAPADGAPLATPVATTIATTRVGFSISKRVGAAVVRNLVKRRLRESIRRRLSRLAPGWDIVITARPAAAGATYGELDAELARLLERARLLARDARPAAASISPTADRATRPEHGSDRGLE
jgi:ribonuclease P protein component